MGERGDAEMSTRTVIACDGCGLLSPGFTAAGARATVQQSIHTIRRSSRLEGGWKRVRVRGTGSPADVCGGCSASLVGVIEIDEFGAKL
ncbi:MAG: hypothetical protein IPH53_20515 [Flavobacteriales bacterium]|nr:hypothetical protein [Flavobacteriales bacterium]